MSTLNVIIVVGGIVLFFVFGIWYTVSKFDNIEKGETDRRKNVEEEMEVEERKDSS